VDSALYLLVCINVSINIVQSREGEEIRGYNWSTSAFLIFIQAHTELLRFQSGNYAVVFSLHGTHLQALAIDTPTLRWQITCVQLDCLLLIF
jgi:hypothetical protein